MNFKKRRIKKRIIATLLVLVMIPQFVAYSFAEDVQALAASPQAYFFTYNNGSSYNSRSAASNAVLSNLWSMGFEAGEFLNNYASTIFSVIKNKEVTVIVSQGFWYQTELPAPSLTTRIHSDRKYLEYDSEAYPIGTNDAVVRDLPYLATPNKVSNLVILAAPFSSHTDGYVVMPDGSLYEMYSVAKSMREKVSKCAIGWQRQLDSDSPEMVSWLTYFFEACEKGYTIKAAYDEATSLVRTDSDNAENDVLVAHQIYTYASIVGDSTGYIDD